MPDGSHVASRPEPAPAVPGGNSQGGLFVFAGAGVSLSMPAGLPLFWMLKDEVLAQLGLWDRLSGEHRGSALTGRQEVALGLAPEPFMQALRQADDDIDVDGWLAGALGGGEPNAGHVALAGLALAGAKVWTVNFDGLVERAAGPGLRVAAWPDDPPDGPALCKPHGTAGGPLIASSDAVLKPLAGAWRDRLAADLAECGTVVFVGYSARDLDLQPLWRELTFGKRIVWFDRPDKQDALRRLAVLGRDPNDPLVELLPAAGDWTNPTAAFVAWCQDAGVSPDPDPALVARLGDRVPPRRFPVLTAHPGPARAAVLSVLGDAAAARRGHLLQAARGPDRATAARAAAALTVNHGGRAVERALAAAALLPPGRRRDRIARKRVSILFNEGRHDEVLRLAGDGSDGDPLGPVLRSGSTRMTGSLDDAAALADQAVGLALAAAHPVLAANAGLQQCYALMWGGRLADARRALRDRLVPYAGLAATRWVAWAHVIDAALTVHEHDPSGPLDRPAIAFALRALSLADSLFAAEGLVDGRISALTVRLTALRLDGDSDSDYAEVRRLVGSLAAGDDAGTLYARGHAFTQEALDLEDGQLAVRQGHDEAGRGLLRRVAASRYPLHAALGELALAASAADENDASAHARAAGRIAERIGAGRVAEQADAALAGRPAPVYFP